MPTLERPNPSIAQEVPQASYSPTPEADKHLTQEQPNFAEVDTERLEQMTAYLTWITLESLAPKVLAMAERARGERQAPDEPNGGFKIERLEGVSQHPVPVEEALPWDADHRAKEFAQQYVDGRTPIEIVDDAWAGVGQGKPGFLTYFKVAGSKFKDAVAAGKVRADIFGSEGKVKHAKPGAEVLDTLVDTDQKQSAVEAYYHQQAKHVEANYIDDLAGIDNRDKLGDLLEAYEFEDGGNIRLLNFSSTPLSEEQLRQAANVLRSFSDKSGGELFKRLHTILILPEDHPKMSFKAEDEEGEFDLPHSGEAKDGSLFISDRAIQRPEDRKPRSERVERYWANYYDQFRLPEEPIEGPGSPAVNASNFDWEILLAHELEHIALPPNEVELEGPGPTLYSRVRKREHEAELGAIEYKGGLEAVITPEDQRRAKQEMWRRRRGSDDGGLTYKQPLGPRFVVCRQLDITHGPLPARLRYPDRPLPTEVWYRLVPEA